MKDENLTFWTKAPNFFLVATYQGEIVGMIGIQKKEETGTQTGLEGEGTNERFFCGAYTRIRHGHTKNSAAVHNLYCGIFTAEPYSYGFSRSINAKV